MNEEKKKILLAEDEKMLAGILQDRLAEIGYEVLRAEDGEEGLSSALENNPDLIITDILLPVMDGVEMIRKIRENGREIPIIILTNLEKVENIDGIMQEPRDSVLKKTYFTLERLTQTIKDKVPLS